MNNLAAPNAMPAKPGIANAIVKALLRPQFVAVMVVLVVAALSLGAATQYLRLYFRKEPVAIAKPLGEIPATLGPWVQVSVDTSLDPEMQDVLGTTQYIFRDYVDSRQITAVECAEFKDKTTGERSALLAQLQTRLPTATVRLAVTYYTGMVDTVAHIPDRCYVADGYTPESKETPLWKMADKNHDPIDVRVSLIHFEDSTAGRGSTTNNVAYFFQCNGAYEYDALTGVRIRLQNLFERHAYYAKVELMTRMSDRAKSDAVMQDFFTNALPEVEKAMPNWQAVQAGKWSEKSPVAKL